MTKIRPNNNKQWQSDERLPRITFCKPHLVATKCQSLDWSEYWLWELEKNWIIFDEYFPVKCLKFNKHNHKLSNWITSDMLKSIEFRGKWYKHLKTYSSENDEYERLKHNITWIHASRLQSKSSTTTNLANLKMIFKGYIDRNDQ